MRRPAAGPIGFEKCGVGNPCMPPPVRPFAVLAMSARTVPEAVTAFIPSPWPGVVGPRSGPARSGSPSCSWALSKRS